jgi:hypothetical protein
MHVLGLGEFRVNEKIPSEKAYCSYKPHLIKEQAFKNNKQRPSSTYVNDYGSQSPQDQQFVVTAKK